MSDAWYDTHNPIIFYNLYVLTFIGHTLYYRDDLIPTTQQIPVVVKPRPSYTATATATDYTINNHKLQHSHTQPSDTPVSMNDDEARQVAAVLNTGKINIKIKKRDPLQHSCSRNNIHSDNTSSTAGVTAEQREAEYERLRAQIFAADLSHNTSTSANHTKQQITNKPRATGHVELLNSVVAGQRRTNNNQPNTSHTANEFNDEYRRNRAIPRSSDPHNELRLSQSHNNMQYHEYDNDVYQQQQQKPRKPNLFNANEFPTLGK